MQGPGNSKEHNKIKNTYWVLHGESSKRLATPRNTKDKKHLQSTQSAQPTNLTDQAPSTTERTAWETHNKNWSECQGTPVTNIPFGPDCIIRDKEGRSSDVQAVQS